MNLSRKNWRQAFPAMVIFAMLTVFLLIASQPASGTDTSAIQRGPAALAKFLARHPDRLAIVLVSTPGCPFCKIVREHQLAPLHRESKYKQVALFEIMMRDTDAFDPIIEKLKRFEGSTSGPIDSPAALSVFLDIHLAPTVLFIAGNHELSEPMVGYGSGDFYASYLTERIDQAQEKIKESSKL